jgi:hypothetical protein
MIEDFFHLPPLSTTPARWCTLSCEYLREFSKKLETALMVYLKQDFIMKSVLNPHAANAYLVNCNIILAQKLMRLRVLYIHFLVCDDIL